MTDLTTIVIVNLAAAAVLAVALVAVMRIPFGVRRQPAVSRAELRAHRAWLDPIGQPS